MGGALLRMGKRVALLYLLLGTTPVGAADSWRGEDKALHFGVSALFPATGYVAGTVLLGNGEHGLLVGTGLGLGAGIAKELYDLGGRGNASWKDIAWDVAGLATGATLSWAVDQLFFAPARRRLVERASRPLSREYERRRTFERALERQLERAQLELRKASAPR